MAFRITFIVLIALLGSSVLAVDGPIDQIAVAEEPINTTSTKAPETTTKPPETTTITTSTEAPTTTSSSTTEPPTTKSTSTTVAPTPAPEPTPPPKPDVGKWSFKNDNNKTCLVIQMAAQLNFSYTTIDNTTKNVLYNFPANNTVTDIGSCSNVTDKASLKWGNADALNHVSFAFDLNTTTSQYYLTQLAFEINVSSIVNDAKANQILKLYHVRHEFETPKTMSYHCTKVQTLNLTKTETDTERIGFVEISHVQFQAFENKDDDKFSEAKDCDAIDTPDIVPIAVGCALAGLVVIVLIAYLVGRRRAQARGYLSM